MRIRGFSRGAILGFWLCLISSVSFCYGTGNTVEVIGIGECADCVKSNIKSSQAFSGLWVTIDCKAANGELKTRAFGELEKDGKFKISLPQDIVENGDLKEQCHAQLHSASSKPCPTHNSLEASKIVFSSKTDDKQTFTTAGKLKFSPVTCTSACFWPHSNYPPLPKLPPFPKSPPFPKTHPWKTFFPFPPTSFPPVYKKPLPPPVPIFKKPLPPPVPVYKKLVPPPVPKVKKPLPPLVPKVKKPLPPSVPKFKKPSPPPTPIFKKPLPPPIFKPLPPFPKTPPIFKKPCPPIPKIPSIPTLPPFHKIPPKYFHHPKFRYFPPPYSPSP